MGDEKNNTIEGVSKIQFVKDNIFKGIIQGMGILFPAFIGWACITAFRLESVVENAQKEQELKYQAIKIDFERQKIDIEKELIDQKNAAVLREADLMNQIGELKKSPPTQPPLPPSLPPLPNDPPPGPSPGPPPNPAPPNPEQHSLDHIRKYYEQYKKGK